MIDAQERPVAFFSQSLNCVTRRELLAVVRSIKQFHTYLYGQQFIVCTDHSALQWLINFRQAEEQVARWLEVLQSYNFTIQHQPGLKHGNADALFRGNADALSAAMLMLYSAAMLMLYSAAMPCG